MYLPYNLETIRYLTLFERDYTTTNHQTSLAVKSILAQMINTILIPLLTAYYIKKNIYSSSGLADNIFMMSVTNALVAPFMLLINPANLIKKLKICFGAIPSNEYYT